MDKWVRTSDGYIIVYSPIQYVQYVQYIEAIEGKKKLFMPALFFFEIGVFISLSLSIMLILMLILMLMMSMLLSDYMAKYSIQYIYGILWKGEGSINDS
jgi:hypothetical protein